MATNLQARQQAEEDLLNWRAIDGLRDHLVHRARATGHSIAQIHSLSVIKGSMMILTPKRPSTLALTAADYCGTHVVQLSADGAGEVLVRGRTGPVETAGRTTNIRFWEESLFAHALAHWREGVIPTELLPGQARPQVYE